VSVLAVHHLAAHGKAALFGRIAAALGPGGRFVLGDVVVPELPEDSVIPIEAGFDRPDLLADQLSWLVDAGFAVSVDWGFKDLAVVRADVQATV
jgi:SAM-dependent methyltransferase